MQTKATMIVTSPYDAIADWYDASVRPHTLESDIVLAHLFDLLGNVRHQFICDLACGQGRAARLLAPRGASVIGIDLSAHLLAIAQRDERSDPLGISYLQENAETLASVRDATFDGVVCNMALVDIANLQATIHSVSRVVRPGGWFTFSLTHPCFQAPHSYWDTAADGAIRRAVSRYFAEGFWRSRQRDSIRGRVGAYHRTLATYLNTLTHCGFTITDVVEPRPQNPAQAWLPGYYAIPAFLLLRCWRTRGPETRPVRQPFNPGPCATP